MALIGKEEGMRRLVVCVSLSLVALALNIGCFNDTEKMSPAGSQAIGKREIYTFSTDQRTGLSDSQPLKLPPGTTLEDALNQLGGRLAQTYFSKTYLNKETDIRFEIKSIDQIPASSGPLRIAVINMVDKDRDAMKYFFQGSGGAQTTFFMLCATFMQPHLNPPLIDGLIFLYNGTMLSELDHINLRGILIPRLVQRHVYQVIRRAQR